MELRDDFSKAGLDAFCRQLIVVPGAKVAEIGSFGGESTVIFAAYADIVFAIDPWADSYRELIKAGCAHPWVLDYLDANPLPAMNEIEAGFDARTADFANIVKIRAASEAAVAQFADCSLDLVYIDTVHTREAVIGHIREWRRKVKPGGVLAGHDYDCDIWPQVVAAVESELGSPDFVFEDTSWAVRVS